MWYDSTRDDPNTKQKLILFISTWINWDYLMSECVVDVKQFKEKSTATWFLFIWSVINQGKSRNYDLFWLRGPPSETNAVIFSSDFNQNFREC